VHGLSPRASLCLPLLQHHTTCLPPRARARNSFPPPSTWDLDKHTLQAYRPYSRSCAFGIANIPHTTHSRLEIYAPEEIRNTPQTSSPILPRVLLGIGQHGSDTLRARRRQGNCLPIWPPPPHCARLAVSPGSGRLHRTAGARESARITRLTHVLTEIGKRRWRVTHLRCLLDAGLADQHGGRACHPARLRR
jgi:hypothetical protein